MPSGRCHGRADPVAPCRRYTAQYNFLFDEHLREFRFLSLILSRKAFCVLEDWHDQAYDCTSCTDGIRHDQGASTDTSVVGESELCSGCNRVVVNRLERGGRDAQWYGAVI